MQFSWAGKSLRDFTPPPGLELAETVRAAHFVALPGCDSSARVLPDFAFAFRPFAAESAVVRLRLTGRRFSGKIDAAARTRTWDNHVNSVVLYHLSYGGTHSSVVGTFS
jgi:hypothetical protein